jgi:hypothetical protein
MKRTKKLQIFCPSSRGKFILNKEEMGEPGDEFFVRNAKDASAKLIFTA